MLLQIVMGTTIPRSSHPELFCKKGVLRNFAKFTLKHFCQKTPLTQKPVLKVTLFQNFS